MDPEKTALIEKLKAFVKGLGIPVQKAYLFGSRARGDYLKNSDVDVVLVSDGFAGKDFFERMVFVSKKWGGPEALEALCYTPEEFEKKKNQLTIVQKAVRTGILLTA